jgi:O-antigen/teichoic acid export membrane protein
MVMYFCGDAANGLYTAAYKIPNLLTICGSIFIEAWQFSAVIESNKSGESETIEQSILRKQRVTRFFTVIFKGYTGVLFLGAGAMILFSRIFARVLFAPGFFAAWVYIPVLIAATVFSALSNFTSSVYMVEKKSNMALLTAAIGALVNLLLNFILIPAMGPMGAALATLIAYTVVLASRLYNARRYIPFRCQPLRLGINTVLIILLALLSCPIMINLPWALVVFTLIVLNNIFPILHSMRRWFDRHRTKKV